MRKFILNLAIAVKVILSVSQLAYGGERPASAPPIDERLTGIESRVNRHDAEIAELSRKIDALKLAIRCPCPRGGVCICGEDCVCPNCPKHSKKRESTVVPSGLENQDDGIPFYGVSWKGTTPTNKGTELLFFGASWCTACPVAETRLGSAKSEIYYIDCTDSNPIAERYGINGFPYLLKIQDGRFDEGRAGDAVHEVAARDWLNGRTLTAGAGANTVGGKPSAPAATSRPRVVMTRPSLSLVRKPGIHWNQPGELRSHLINEHGYSSSQLSGLSYGQLEILKDNDHNSWGHGGHPYSNRTSYQIYQPRVYYSSRGSYCPTCPR